MAYTPIIFGIAGTKGSGKDTIAGMIDYCLNVGLAKATYDNYCKAVHPTWGNYESERIIHYADNLKNICSYVLNIDRKCFDSSKYKDDKVYIFHDETFVDIDDLDTNAYGIVTIEDLRKYDSLSVARIAIAKTGRIPCITLRTVMQYIGTNIFRNRISDNIWVDSCIKKAKDIASLGWCIIADVRFKNEADAIISSNAKTILIKVERNNIKDNTVHESEQIYFKTDYTINNDSSIMILFYRVLAILQQELNLQNDYR